MIGKKINQLATELAPVSTDLTIIGDPTTGVSKKITLAQLGAIFSGAVSFYTNLAGFPAVGDINVIYCAKDTQKLYLWSGSAYVEVFPSQALLDTYQLRSEKGNANGYASLDSQGKVPISQLPSSIMEYKGTWNASNNTPTLANGTGDTGDVYICNVAGTVNFGAGPITFAVGDYVIYSGTIWQRSSGAVGTVTSVAVSRSGDALAITDSPVTTSGTINIGFAGNSTQYINGAGNLVTFPGVINEAQNLITEVYNKTGATLTKGTVVYINGGQGNLPAVTKALATGDSTSAQTYGIVRNDITNNNNGYVVVAGRISDLDTQAYTEGTQLYLSPTTAGTFTSTKPYAPQHLVYVGIVVRAHPTQGVIEVKIQNGYEMDELHNVAAQSPDNNDILQYKTATSLWTKVAGTTSNIAEGSNLYYTDARSRAALSFTAGSGAYNSTTGVITIPTNTNQLTNGANYITLGSLSASSPLSYNNGTGAFSISQANTSTNGFLSSTDWNTFNGKQAALNGTGFVKISGTTISYDNSTYYLASNPNAYIPLTALSAGAGISYNNTTGVIASTITQYTDANARAAISLTTTGTSGAATYNSTTGVLNVPQYAPDLSGYVPTSRTLTINGTAYDLSANRSWSVGTVTSVGLSSATSGVTIGSTPITTSGTITLAIATASGSQQGLLSSTDWTTFNNKQNALTNPVTGTGTTNYLPKFTGASTIGNSLVFDNGTNVGINSNDPKERFWVHCGTNVNFALQNYSGLYLASVNDANTELSTLQIASTNFKVTSSGNLGLGVTPSAWQTTSGSTAFQFLGSYLYGYRDTNLLIGNNAYYDGTWKYYASGIGATKFNMGNGAYDWAIAPSGTAGNAISFTQAMTLDASGNLALGGTSNKVTGLSGGGTGFTVQATAAPTIGVWDNSDASYYLQLGQIEANSYLWNIANGFLSFGTANTERMRITSGGEVGIGTSTMSSGIPLSISAGSGLNTNIAFQQAGTNKWFIRNLDGTDDFSFYSVVNSAERMRITSSGLIGIGTSSPDRLLTISPSSGDAYINLRRPIAASTQSTIEFNTAGTNDWLIRTDDTSANLKFYSYGFNNYALILAKSSGAATFSSTLGINGVSDNIKSGTYTPTLSSIYNVASSTAFVCQYMRVGNVVTVSGVINVTATATNTWTRISMTLPISSNFDFSYRAGGGGGANSTNNVCVILAGASTSVVYLDAYPNSTNNLSYYFSYTYQII